MISYRLGKQVRLLALAALFLAPFLGWGQTTITSLSVIGSTGDYVITGDIDASSFTSSIESFSGTLQANIDPATKMPYRIKNLSAPLFTTLTGTVKNLVLEDVAISGHSGNTGAIACKANGSARIYNVGILSGEVGGTGYTGGLVGLLDGTNATDKPRVVNCYSYANITGGSNVAGIVGFNNYSTTASDIRTMVMNCMFYGDITGGTTISPVYGGNNINNLQGGLNTFNYYAYGKLKTKTISTGKYNCTLASEDKYLNRFEFYRLLLNSNKKLAAFYVTGSADDANIMLKWVLETADRTNSNPYPYPVLKSQGTYPSIINPDIENAPDSIDVGPNKGGKLGRTLTVNISNTQTTGGQTKPTGASITITSLPLQRTDKDFDRFNFNYDKVQLPYYNDVGTGNYTGNKVVTGWKITAITSLANDPYTGANYDYTKTYANNPEYFEYPNYNFADRKSSKKDLYSVSGRVFSQGAYFDVPYGVTSITIEPYWATAAYIADPNYDVVYKNDYTGKQNVTQTGTQVGSNAAFNSQTIYTSISNNLLNTLTGTTVYDNAIVLVGNLHLDNVPSQGTKPFTLMSVDEDGDHEPDYSLIYHHKSRTAICPIRFDFLAVPGTAQVQKPNGANLVCNFTIFKTKGWFEVTNTSFMYSNQIEYENLNSVTKVNAPLILLGGVFDQFVSTQRDEVPGKTIYIHLGGNVWIDQFGLGTHGDGGRSTPHVPVSVTGGDYVGFYLTGTYNKDAIVRDDNAECYISGGRFKELAGAAQEQIGSTNSAQNGNVRWQIYNADITEFYGGGVNDAKPVQGNITTEIFNSSVHIFCGGPKFGNMASGKKVTTTAEGCVFDKYFGAGFGGNSYSRKKYRDLTTYDFNTWQNYYYKASDGSGDRGKYYDGETTQSSQQGAGTDYGKKGPGVGTDFDYEFFVWSDGRTGARFYVKFISFSLAQCNDVESKLKRCIINGNFYGGGSLGKVTGTATSELDGCTVMGDAYGAGFSATLPTIWVRDAGFKLKPNTTNQYYFPSFNKDAGVFEHGVFSDSTEFTWKKVASYPGEGGAGFDGTQVITTTSLDKTDLGSVGAVALTIKGNTTVQGNVFGGGEESQVAHNTLVKILEKAKVLGNVYGGGNMGEVGGNTKVVVNGQSNNNGQGTGSGNNPNND